MVPVNAGVVVKKKESDRYLLQKKQEYLSAIGQKLSLLSVDLDASEEELKKCVMASFFNFNEPFDAFVRKAYQTWIAFRWYNYLLSVDSGRDFADFLTELFFHEL